MNREGAHFETGKIYDCSRTNMKAKVTFVDHETGEITIVLCDAQGHAFTGKEHIGNIVWNEFRECEWCYFEGADISISACTEVT